MKFLDSLKEKAEALSREVAALSLCMLDRRTPWYAKAWLSLVLLYAASPIDLIPDFIPVLGLLDDLLIVPAGIALALKMIPPEVVKEKREEAAKNGIGLKSNPVGAVVIILVWILVIFLIVKAFIPKKK